MNDYHVITLQEFQELLRHIRGSKIVTLTTVTQPELKKGGPKGLFKIARVNGIINCDYSSCMSKIDPEFVPGSRKWGTRLSNSPFVSHVLKDGQHKLYLEIKIQRVVSCEYKIDCSCVKYEDIKDYLRERTDEIITWRDYSVLSIISIDIDGAGYILKRS